MLHLIKDLLLPCLFIFSTTVFSFDEDDFIRQYFWREVIALPAGKRPTIGLVLSGGGARGLAHIGVLKVLEEEDFPIDIITGASVGALIGALYSSGMPVEKLEVMAEEIGWTDLTNISVPSVMGFVVIERLFSTEKMEKYIAKHIGNKTFTELNIPFGCIATDIRTGEKIIFRDGKVALCARASATIPGIFEPVEFRHRFLIDGGLVDNIPTDVAKLLGADIIIAVNVTSDYSGKKPSAVIPVLSQAISIQCAALSQDRLKEANIVINPDVGDVAIYELWRNKECISAGIIATRKLIPQLKQLVMDKTYEYLLKK